jgi:hypothetical protein
MDLETQELNTQKIPEGQISENPLEEEISSEEGENPESSSSEEREAEEKAKAPPKTQSKDALLRSLKKQKYNLLDKNEELRKEKEALQAQLERTIESGTVAYGKTVYNDLQRAIDKKRLAIETGDAEALIEADAEFARADRAVFELERYLESRPLETEEKEPSQEATEVIPPSKQEAALDFIRENPDLDPNSRHYNPSKAQEVANFIAYLNQELTKEGKADQIMTDAYFMATQEYANSLDKKGLSQKNLRIASSNQSYRNNVAGVRQGLSSTGGDAKYRNVTLTANERLIAQRMKIPEKEYLIQKIEDIKNGQIKQSR